MRRLLCCALLALGACGDNLSGSSDDAATPEIDAAGDAPIAAPPGLTSCALDRPGELPRPPSGTLPCELLPPGFVGP
jgi:hypothetical protein